MPSESCMKYLPQLALGRIFFVPLFLKSEGSTRVSVFKMQTFETRTKIKSQNRKDSSQQSLKMNGIDQYESGFEVRRR